MAYYRTHALHCTSLVSWLTAGFSKEVNCVVQLADLWAVSSPNTYCV